MEKNKKSTRPCPNCNNPLPLGSFWKYLSKCESCYKVVCDNCSFKFHCLDCHATLNAVNEVDIYNNIKYDQVVL